MAGAIKRPKDIEFGSVVEIDKRGLTYYQWSVRRKGFPTRAGQKACASDAWDAVREILKEQASGCSREATVYTLASWINECVFNKIHHRKRSGHPISLVTLDGYRRTLNRWVIPTHGHLRLSQLTREHVAGRQPGSIARNLVDAATKGQVGKSAMCAVMSALGWVLDEAIHLGHLPSIDCNYAIKMFMGKDYPVGPVRTHKNYTSDDTWHKLLKRCGDHWLSDCLMGGALTGARETELIGIKWSDLDLDAKIWRPGRSLARLKKDLARAAGVGTISEQRLKTTQSADAVGMTDAEVEFFKKLKAKATANGTLFSEFVFCQPSGKPLDVHLVSKALRAFRCEIKHGDKVIREELTNEDGTEITFRSATRRFAATYGNEDIYTVLRDQESTVKKHYRGTLDEEALKELQAKAKIQRAAKESLHERITKTS